MLNRSYFSTMKVANQFEYFQISKISQVTGLTIFYEAVGKICEGHVLE